MALQSFSRIYGQADRSERALNKQTYEEICEVAKSSEKGPLNSIFGHCLSWDL